MFAADSIPICMWTPIRGQHEQRQLIPARIAIGGLPEGPCLGACGFNLVNGVAVATLDLNSLYIKQERVRFPTISGASDSSPASQDSNTFLRILH